MLIRVHSGGADWRNLMKTVFLHPRRPDNFIWTSVITTCKTEKNFVSLSTIKATNK